jgi:hypothetical protein
MLADSVTVGFFFTIFKSHFSEIEQVFERETMLVLQCGHAAFRTFYEWFCLSF